MKLNVSDKVAEWYKNELEIDSGSAIRFFPRYGGIGGHIPGFSLGINHDQPTDSHVSTLVNEVTFFIEKEDEWYFKDVNLTVSLDEDKNEPSFSYD